MFCPRNTLKTRKKGKNTKIFVIVGVLKGIRKNMSDLVYKEESYKIIGACFEVYKEKGCGFTEPVYQECLTIELELQGIPFVPQPKIQLEYKGRVLEQYFVPDFICYDKIIVEIKALSELIEANKAQTFNYLNATKYELALLINFGHFPKLEYKRIANNQIKPTNVSLREELKSWL
jgi:GxxExxY protein